MQQQKTSFSGEHMDNSHSVLAIEAQIEGSNGCKHIPI